MTTQPQGRTGEQHATAVLVTVKEAAEQLRKSEAQLRWMIHTSTAPRSALIGGRRMFRQSDIDTYIEEAFDAAKA